MPMVVAAIPARNVLDLVPGAGIASSRGQGSLSRCLGHGNRDGQVEHVVRAFLRHDSNSCSSIEPNLPAVIGLACAPQILRPQV